MTIALGVLGVDSVVLAADTEITWSQMKSSERKVWSTSGCGGLAVTGAGDTDYLRALSELIRNAFYVNNTCPVDDIETIFSEIIEDFYDKHVVPFNPQPEVWLVIGAERFGKRRLWSTARNALTSQPSYACVGTGCEYVAPLLGILLDRSAIDPTAITAVIAERVSSYAVSYAKDRVQHCGKGTNIVRVGNDAAVDVDAGVISTLEHHFSDLEKLQALGVQFVCGYPYADEASAREAFERYLLSLRSSITRLDGIRTESKQWRLE